MLWPRPRFVNTLTQQPVLVLKLKDAPGALAAVAAKLAAKRVNITYVYGSAAGAGNAAMLASAVSAVSP